MAFPAVEATATGDGSGVRETSHTVNLPTGIVAGDQLLVLFAGERGAGSFDVTWPTGWAEVGEAASPTDVEFAVGARVADGTEGSTITVTTTGFGSRTAHISYRISGASGNVEMAFAAEATTATPNPPSLTPSWGTKETLWLAAVGAAWVNNVEDLPPTNYTNQIRSNEQFVETGAVVSAQRALEALSEDPGTFTMDAAEPSIAATIAIEPQAASSIVSGAGSATGTSTVTGAGAATAAAAGSATGQATAVAVGASTASAAGTAQGLATVSGVGAAPAITSAAGFAAGTSMVSGVGAAIGWAAQSSATDEPWSRVRSDETDWDGGATLWDVGVGGLVRTVWDAGVNGVDWTAQSSTAEVWTVV